MASNRTKLEAVAVGLGMGAGVARQMPDHTLRAWIKEHSDSDDVSNRTGGGIQADAVKSGPPAKPTRPPQPDTSKPIMLKSGHVVIMLVSDPDGQYAEGDMMLAQVNDDGTVDLHDEDGNHVGNFEMVNGEDFENTGVSIGDWVQAHAADYSGGAPSPLVIHGPVIGITAAGAFAVADYTLVPQSDDKYAYRHSNQGFSHKGRNYTGSKMFRVEHDDVVQHWPLSQPWRLTDEAWSMFAKAVSGSDWTLKDEAFVPDENLPYPGRVYGMANFLQTKDGTPYFTGPYGHEDPPDPIEVLGRHATNADTLPTAVADDFLPITWFIADPQERDDQAQDQAGESRQKEGMMQNSRKSLADLKSTPDNPKRNTIPSDKIKELVEETVTDSDGLHDIVLEVIRNHRDELRDAMNIDEDFKQLGEAMLSDLEDAFQKYEKQQNEWRKNVEQKITSKVEFNLPDLPTFDLKDPHHKMEDLMYNMVLRLPTLLVGPSGSGKTTAAIIASDKLDLPFGYIPMGPTQTESKFAGYTDASGHFIATEFYYRYRYGGVMLLDEMDAAHPGALLWVNAALANRKASFPLGLMTEIERTKYHPKEKKGIESGGLIEMHPDCVIVAAANTYGKGADLIYQGRNALDGATLKRFKVMTWDYDPVLERKMSGDDAWVDFVQAVRESVYDLRMEHIVSPVDSKDGAKMIAGGQDWEKVAAQTVFAGLKKEQVEKIVKNPEHSDKIKKATSKLVKRQGS